MDLDRFVKEFEKLKARIEPMLAEYERMVSERAEYDAGRARRAAEIEAEDQAGGDSAITDSKPANPPQDGGDPATKTGDDPPPQPESNAGKTETGTGEQTPPPPEQAAQTV